MPLDKDVPEVQIFVGFIDILGFKDRLTDWPAARDFHRRMMGGFELLRCLMTNKSAVTDEKGERTIANDFTARILSDSLIFTTVDPLIALNGAAFLQNILGDHGLFCRGCIAYGRHIEEANATGDYVVVSEALSRAAEGEATTAVYPRVYLHPSAVAQIADAFSQNYALHQFASSLLLQADDGLWSLDPGHGIPHLDLIEGALRREIAMDHPSAVARKYRWLADQIDFLNIWDKPDRRRYDLYYRRADLSEAVAKVVGLGAKPLGPDPAEPVVRFLRYPRPEVVRRLAPYRIGSAEPLQCDFAENVKTFARIGANRSVL